MFVATTIVGLCAHGRGAPRGLARWVGWRGGDGDAHCARALERFEHVLERDGGVHEQDARALQAAVHRVDDDQH